MAYQNFYTTKLYTDVGAADTTITLETPPTVTSGRLVLEARNVSKREVIKYTGVSGNQVTGVLRGQGGTTAQTHLANTLVEMNLTAEDLEDAINVPNDIVTRFDESLGDFIASGLVWSQTALLVGEMTAGVVYIDGERLVIGALSGINFTASKDTYVDVGVDGVVDYDPVANGASAPALAASHVRIAKVVTNGSGITSVVQTGVDSLGNTISPSGSVGPTQLSTSVWWEEISRVTVSSGTVLDTGTIPARKYLKLMLVDTGAGANGTDAVFNSDTGANYAYARTLNGSAFLNNTSQTSLEIMGNYSGMQFATVEIINIAAIEKVLQCTWISGPQAGTRNSAAQVPSHGEYSGKWVNTSTQITRIKCTRRSGSFAAGSELVVLGHD